MENVDVFLNESNNLKDAINMFIQTGCLNVPVIDIEGNLVGEVTARELMEVCLPRYILWMDDMDPIIHFEPFQNMLAQEDNTWLAEILNYNMAVVQKDEPLMKAAIQMTKKEVSRVYVLDDKKLIGIITLQYFLNRILRA
ncbi:MAG: CBS domain-containing protein [Rhodopseudomonas palustris]|nr:CBS domain-containing protein [Rhodopseudomonas palustris]